MACDTNSLINLARTFSSLGAMQHMQVQTYMLALLAGGSTDPSTLAQAARCFSCLTPAQLQQVKAYLLCQLAMGSAESSSAPEASDWTVSESALGSEAVDFTREIDFPDGFSFMAMRYRVTGSGAGFLWDGNLYDQAAWTVTMPVGGISYDFQVAWWVGPFTFSEWSDTKTATASPS